MSGMSGIDLLKSKFGSGSKDDSPMSGGFIDMLTRKSKSDDVATTAASTPPTQAGTVAPSIADIDERRRLIGLGAVRAPRSSILTG